MTEPVTSKYEIVYWVKLIGILAILIIGTIVIICNGGYGDSENTTQNIYITLALFLAFVIGITAAMLGLSLPRKITIDTGQMTIDYYLTNKRIVINYTEIDS
jgi:hypothetical protein